jgi:hypothetical protein
MSDNPLTPDGNPLTPNPDSSPVAHNCPPLPTFPDAVPEQEPPDTPDLPPRQLAALELMVLGHTDISIAAQLKIGRRTLYNWRTHDPNFRAAFDHHHRDLLTQTTTRFRSLLDTALDALEKQVKDPYTPTSHRAAKTLLSLSRLANHLAPRPPVPSPAGGGLGEGVSRSSEPPPS